MSWRICPACGEGSTAAFSACPLCETDLSPVPTRGLDQLVGMMVSARYSLQAYVQEGAMGVVYRASHLALQMPIAVKLMKPPRDGGQGVRTRRFAQEARTASRLHHPHIMTILDFGRSPGGLLFMVSEFIDGITLTHLLRQEGPLPLSRVLRIGSQLLAAVEHAHQHRVIHRDLKLDNVMLTSFSSGEDYIKVLDFGIALVVEPQVPGTSRSPEVVGTPSFMAPEVIRGELSTEASDVYACGMIFYALLSGVVPLEGPNVEQTLRRHLEEDAPSLLGAHPEVDLPPQADLVLQRALHRNPHIRYQSVDVFREEFFSAVLAQRPLNVGCTACHRRADSTHGYCSTACLVQAGASEGPAPARPRAAPAATAWRESPTPGHSDDAARALLPLATAPTVEQLPPHRAAEAGPSRSTLEEPQLSPTVVLSPRRAPRTGPPAPAARQADAPADLQASEPGEPLLGVRAADLSRLRTWLRDGPPLLELLGPVGRGKRALMHATLRLAAAAGWSVHHVMPDPHRAGTPWHPVLQLVLSLLHLPPVGTLPDLLEREAMAAGLPPADAAQLARLQRLLGEAGARGADQDPTVFGRETSHAALRCLGLAADKAPLLMALEDLTDFDASSRALFQAAPDHLLRTSGAVRWLVVGRTPALPATGHRVALDLPPPEEAAVAALLQQRPPAGPLSPPERSRLEQNALSSLLYLEQALQYLEQGGKRLPRSISGLVWERVQDLPPLAQEALYALCCAGCCATTGLVREVVGPEGAPPAPEALGVALQLLQARGFIQEQRGDLLLVQHPLLVDVVHDALETQQRRALHARLYQALRTADVPLPALARHAYEAQLGEASLALQQQAAAFCCQLDTPEAAALIHYPRALHVGRWELLYPEDDARLLRLRLAQARALLRTGHELTAHALLLRLRGAAAGELTGHVLLEEARLSATQGKLAEAEAQLQQGLELARAHPTATAADAAVQLLLELAGVHQARRDLLQAAAALQQGTAALEQARSDGALPREHWRLYHRLADLQLCLEQPDLALAAAHRALLLARTEDAPGGQAAAHLLLGRAHQLLARPDQAEVHLAAATELFAALGDRQGQASSLLQRGRRAGPPGREALLSQAEALALQVGWQEGAREALRLRETLP